jgi:hypothetical protein
LLCFAAYPKHARHVPLADVPSLDTKIVILTGAGHMHPYQLMDEAQRLAIVSNNMQA